MTAVISRDRVGRMHKIPRLSDRELEVLRTWMAHDTKDAAGKALFISTSTINTHLTRIRLKYKAVGRPCKTKGMLLARALQDGFIHIDDLG
jgi:DNA-binding CsgD family transcriptional regulator